MHINYGIVEGFPGTRIVKIETGLPILFLDESMITYADGIERIWHFPEKRPEPVMKATEPWEIFGKYKCVGGFSGKSFVVKDDKLMMFYSIYHMGDGPEFRSFAYAESVDGVRWVKPDLGDGTNLLIRNKPNANGYGPALPYWEMQNVLFDEHSGLYRAMGHCKLSKGKSGTFYASARDPTKWDPGTFKYAYSNNDIHALLGWFGDAYASYPRVPVFRNGQRRAVGVSVSRDFEKWSTPVLCHGFDSRGPSDYEIYNMPVERVGNYTIAFPIGYQARGFGPLDTEFAFSWSLQDFRQPLAHIAYIPRGLPGSWDDCYVMAAAPVVFKGKTLIYYWGCNFPHDDGFREEEVNEGSVGLAILPENRYCGLSCPRHKVGIVETAWLTTSATKLQWDGDGDVDAIILDESLHPAPRGVIPAKFKIRFELKDAELFSFKLTGD